MTKWCVVPNCKTGSRTAIKRSVFRVPKDAAMWKKWQEAIPGIIKLNQNDVVCERHFTEEDISREWKKIDANGKVIARVTYKYPQLQKHAVPSKFGDYQIGYRNCVPMHEYAKPYADSQMEPPIIANHCNVSVQSSHLKNPETQEISTFIGITDVLHPTTDVAAEICKREPSPFEVSDELPLAKKIVSQIPATVPSMQIGKHELDVHHSTTTTVDAEICKREPFSIEESGELPVAKTFVSQIPAKISSMKISKRTPKENAAVNRDFSAHVPKEWAWVNMRTAIVQQTLFTYAVTKLENDVHCPVIQKAVTLDADGTFQYFVYGRHVNPQGKNLEKTLRSEETLKDVLVKFKGMNICSGLGDISVHLVEPGIAYQDYVNIWRTRSCSLISQKKRCEFCTKTRKCIQQRTARLKNPQTPKRIGNISNPVDQRKVLAMRMKLRCERRQRIRAQDRVKHLTACVKAFMGNHN